MFYVYVKPTIEKYIYTYNTNVYCMLVTLNYLIILIMGILVGWIVGRAYTKHEYKQLEKSEKSV